MDFEAVAKGQNISLDMKIFAIAFTIPKIHIKKSAKHTVIKSLKSKATRSVRICETE